MLHIPSDDINKAGNLSEYWQAFIEYLSNKINSWELWWEWNIERIIQVCKKIEKDHADRPRKSWWDYHDHLYEVTKNYIELYWEKISQKRVIACLLHDNIEDIKWDSFQSFKKLYWTEIAFVVHLLSIKKNNNWIRLETKDEYMSRFSNLASIRKFVKEEGIRLWIPVQSYKKINWDIQREKWKFTLSKNRIKKLSHEIAAIKISDRINNLSTEEVFGIKKAKAKIQQTEKYLLPLARELWNPILLWRLRDEIIKLHSRIRREKTERILNSTES